jgi:hypothetical protein
MAMVLSLGDLENRGAVNKNKRIGRRHLWFRKEQKGRILNVTYKVVRHVDWLSLKSVHNICYLISGIVMGGYIRKKIFKKYLFGRYARRKISGLPFVPHIKDISLLL